jgi:hypothetical protein
VAGGFSLLVTNASHLDVSYLVCAPQVRSNGVWLEVQPPTPPANGIRLPARRGGTVVIPAPSHRGSWRVPVMWVYHPTDAQLVGRRVQYFVERLLDTNAMPRGLSRESYTNYSIEITQ